MRRRVLIPVGGLAAAVVLMVPSVLVYLGLQRLFERGLLGGALKG